MIAKCANPACRARFDYHVGGRFFRFHLDESAEAAAGIHNTHNVVHYWLCPTCSKMFSLAKGDDSKVILRLREQEIECVPSEHSLTAA